MAVPCLLPDVESLSLADRGPDTFAIKRDENAQWYLHRRLTERIIEQDTFFRVDSTWKPQSDGFECAVFGVHGKT